MTPDPSTGNAATRRGEDDVGLSGTDPQIVLLSAGGAALRLEQKAERKKRAGERGKTADRHKGEPKDNSLKVGGLDGAGWRKNYTNK